MVIFRGLFLAESIHSWELQLEHGLGFVKGGRHTSELFVYFLISQSHFPHPVFFDLSDTRVAGSKGPWDAMSEAWGFVELASLVRIGDYLKFGPVEVCSHCNLKYLSFLFLLQSFFNRRGSISLFSATA